MTDMQQTEVAERLYSRSLSDGNDINVAAYASYNVSNNLIHSWQKNNPRAQNGCNENSPPLWIANGKHSATSHGMFHHRQPAPHLVKANPPGYQSDSYGQMPSRPVQLQASRRSRHFVPSCRKDEYYWMKRRKNNEAARKSREKRRNNDMVLAQNVLVLLQENIRLKKDLFAVKMKYNEIEPEEFNDFTRKLEDGDLLSGLTQNLNLADYGIPEHVIKALNSGMEVNLANFMGIPNERKLSSSQQSAGDSGKDESIGSSSDDYQKVIAPSQSVMHHVQGDWSESTGNTAKMETEEVSIKDRNIQDVFTVNRSTWRSTSSPVIHISGQVAKQSPMTNGTNAEETQFYSHDLVKGAEMLQSFIHYSWQQAANNANGHIVEKMANHIVPTTLSPTLSVSPQWLKQNNCSSSSNAKVDDESQSNLPVTNGKDRFSGSRDGSTLSSRASSSSPQSDDSNTAWRNCLGFASSSSSCYQEDWSSKSGDSSSDSSSGSSHVASPRDCEKTEDSNDTGDSDDKSCRLPYKLRFKLATLHGSEQEPAIQ